MSTEITALEDDFDRLGLTVARTVYGQAVARLVEGNLEAANGQIRPMLEEVLVQAAVKTGFTRSRQGQARAAIQYLIAQGVLSERADGAFLSGPWGMLQTNGPHPGTTTAGEARFRLHAATSAARYVVDLVFLAGSYMKQRPSPPGVLSRQIWDTAGA